MTAAQTSREAEQKSFKTRTEFWTSREAWTLREGHCIKVGVTLIGKIALPSFFGGAAGPAGEAGGRADGRGWGARVSAVCCRSKIYPARPAAAARGGGMKGPQKK